jgi:hypothetical protein
MLVPRLCLGTHIVRALPGLARSFQKRNHREVLGVAELAKPLRRRSLRVRIPRQSLGTRIAGPLGERLSV